ncbi:3-hydroxy-2-methylbutyryl-CoA dehydrogenase [Corynebacterium phocae]|uniref:3-hydroxy-2-methylbutyryl-CoA dehydrogenase n=1 Tax=Corynebacterium phocae TaxID=161895 RepID=A0A1L7D3K3_9CORY|nr:SDR family oxidoreductase [Corynebacterium phocae]APT92653.1 3-hydroxy-2-methylbutyryl-CoA dehydrogenase [Corynebacterium phocae]KAA8723706.1 SDR family oxidoreductase [Corynebacterium phocae]
MKLDSNCSAVVTGAASGLGNATARALIDHGVKVVGLDLPSAVDKLEDHGGIEFVPTDVTDPAQVATAIAKATSLAPLRVAVNCAGIAPSQRIVGRKGTHDPAFFAKTIDINLNGTFYVLAAAAGAMAEQDPVDADGQRGVIINTSSVAAFEGQVGQAAYSASKAAVHSLSLTAARDLARSGIRVNAIAPGVVETPMMAQITDEFKQRLEETVPFPSRLAKPEEYPKLALAIIDNDYLNGETIRMDGALRMPPR